MCVFASCNLLRAFCSVLSSMPQSGMFSVYVLLETKADCVAFCCSLNVFVDLAVLTAISSSRLAVTLPLVRANCGCWWRTASLRRIFTKLSSGRASNQSLFGVVLEKRRSVAQCQVPLLIFLVTFLENFLTSLHFSRLKVGQ